MNYEKKYKELVGQIKKAHLYAQTDSTKAVLEDILSELKESEDEKIRKYILSCCEETIKANDRGLELSMETTIKLRDWLEKQGKSNPYSGVSFEYNGHTWGMCARDNGVEILVDGEIKERVYLFDRPQGKSALETLKEEKVDNQNCAKPADKVKPKFHEGDWVVDKKGHIFKIMRVENDFNHITYACRFIEQKSVFWSSYSENDIRLWDISDAKDGDVLVDGNLPFIFKKIDANRYSYAYCGISVDDGFKIESDVESGEWTWMQDIKPATKEQRYFLFAKMREAGYEWDADRKELRKIKPKFHKGEWVTNGIETVQITGYDIDYGYQVDYKGNLQHRDTDVIEKEYHLWTIQDAKAGDVLNSVRVKATIIFKKWNSDGKHINAYCALQKGILIKQEMLWDRDFEPATKEQRDTLMKAIADAGYTFDFDKKDLKNVEVEELTAFEEAVKDMMDDYRDAIDDNKATTEEVKERAAYMLSLIPQKPAEWSEDDEGICRAIINDIANDKSMCTFDISKGICDKKINWLKSIKDRYTWKPSEEQMDALDDFIYAKYPNIEKHGALVKSLYQDLKKLR